MGGVQVLLYFLQKNVLVDVCGGMSVTYRCPSVFLSCWNFSDNASAVAFGHSVLRN